MSNNIAFVFPGQGSQTVGMLADLYQSFDVVKQTFEQASDALAFDLGKIILDGPAEELNQTQITQPALLTASIAVLRLIAEKSDIKPAFLAGHSLGEYSALTAAGVIQFEDALKLVELRGKAMQQAVPAGVGAMAAIIGLADDAVIKACADASAQSTENEVVAAVNFNSPGQVVIAGHKAAVAAAGELCKAAGAKRALPLPVSVPSHCALMKPAAEELAVALKEIQFSAPSFSVINNVDVKAETDAAAIQDALVRQLYCPVRWTETVQFLASQGVTELVEVGAGKVLAGLTKRIEKSLSARSVNDLASLEAFLGE
ncbi:ACP S-malonyltransferase [Catenovulum maritimum]|uniref:Malonyl CoA-acyl carrier protein transacylase n=1 Tax=Catenovulum maritimum TaxID=1513271 RepID=A0A0J8JJZ2_9ALTE|nr:ACP S-malonyltransferase [Catenovulum maritimum]KMT64771.1 malonyl CoA-ACP transacylase [Catenovulum maritimum]